MEQASVARIEWSEIRVCLYVRLKGSWSVTRDGSNKRDDMPFHFGILDSQV